MARIATGDAASLLELVHDGARDTRPDVEAWQRIDPSLGLTPREAEVLCWVARGKTNAEIARALFISPLTVRKHIENIFEKLGVRTRTAAAAYSRTAFTRVERPRIGEELIGEPDAQP